MPGFLAGPQTGFVDRMKGKGMCSSGFVQQIGKSAALAAGGGNIGFMSSVAGVGNGADTTADTLYTAVIPANFFDVAGRTLQLQLVGSIAATSATKTIAFVWGGGSLNQTLLSYTTTGAGTWQALITIWKISASVQGMLVQADASSTTGLTLLGSSTGRSLVSNFTGSETDTAAITLKVTGQSSAATANLCLLNLAMLDAYN